MCCCGCHLIAKDAAEAARIDAAQRAWVAAIAKRIATALSFVLRGLGRVGRRSADAAGVALRSAPSSSKLRLIRHDATGTAAR